MGEVVRERRFRKEEVRGWGREGERARGRSFRSGREGERGAGGEREGKGG